MTSPQRTTEPLPRLYGGNDSAGERWRTIGAVASDLRMLIEDRTATRAQWRRWQRLQVERGQRRRYRRPGNCTRFWRVVEWQLEASKWRVNSCRPDARATGMPARYRETAMARAENALRGAAFCRSQLATRKRVSGPPA